MPPPDPPSSGNEEIRPTDPASAAFIRGLVERGQAAERDQDGKLPPGATHEIVGRTATGEPILKRVRFSGLY